MEKTTYYAQEDGWILDELRQKGDKVEATEFEAKWAIESGTLALDPPAKEKVEDETTAQG